MKRVQVGIVSGVIAGVIDVIPMLIQKLTWDANLSAFSLWVVSGYLIAVTPLKLKASVKGIFISFLVLLPSAFLIGWREPVSLFPIIIMTSVLGSALGYMIDKYGRR